MWQSLVTIGPETSEIRRRKKSMIETTAAFYNGRRPASWRAAIIIGNRKATSTLLHANADVI